MFLEEHCGLESITKAPPQTDTPEFEAMFPFTEQGSSTICLKSALAVAWAFNQIPSPTTPSRTPTMLSSFLCAVVQVSYALFMLLHCVRAALKTNRLPLCYPLLHHPEPSTEAQGARRLMEELGLAIRSLTSSVKPNLVFEGISGMSRELEALAASRTKV